LIFLRNGKVDQHERQQAVPACGGPGRPARPPRLTTGQASDACIVALRLVTLARDRRSVLVLSLL
jgi:hypothetical protein